jgi:predicted nucleotidyltransferase
MPSSLRDLARQIDVPERTLRRAANEGLVHGRRVSDRRYETSFREEAYLRRHWPLLRGLRDALRTEPAVRLAVLFGSVATGQDTERSDVDVLVWLTDPSASRVAGLSGRLERRLGRDVQLVRVEDAERAPTLMADVLVQGRVLVDRDELWAKLKATERTWARRAKAAELPLDQAMPELESS